MLKSPAADSAKAAAAEPRRARAGVRVLVGGRGEGKGGVRVWARELQSAIARVLVDAPGVTVDVVATALASGLAGAGGPDGPDFLGLCRLQEAGAQAGDSLAELGSGPAALCVVPANARRSVRVLLDPPLLQLGAEALGDKAGLARLVAATAVAMHAASLYEPDGCEPGHGLVRLVAELAHGGSAGSGGLARAASSLSTWSTAWRGVGDGDPVLLEAARAALDEQLNAKPPSTADAPQPHARGMLALVLLGLGGTPEGTRRLAEALGEARRAIAEAQGGRSAVATLTALAGRIALALGRAREDEELLGDARACLMRAQRLAQGTYLPGACGLDRLDGEILAADRALARLAGRAPQRPPSDRALVRPDPS